MLDQKVPEKKHLGKEVEYKDQYDPNLLDREDRTPNREIYGIGKALPFDGFDIWNCYEVSVLSKNNLPYIFRLKIVYSSNSKYIVESKSIKLYLNSFNMYNIEGENRLEIVNNLVTLIEGDLSSLLETNVQVGVFQSLQGEQEIFEDFRNLTYYGVKLEEINFTKFNEDPSILKLRKDGSRSIRVRSNLLRSNCKITNQPDWGDVFILCDSEKSLDLNSLAEYIVSFRKESHFHEEICECIFKRLQDLLQPMNLLVACLYTRRGGIDINPVRVSNPGLLLEVKDLISPDTLIKRTLRQ